ncbi:Hypothetical predicted protein [Octopus vulgaris]|uniref:Uncharacterized protein n=1 Tax=Octopus vulgaris TaxID=6645 RepID=A0AA36B5M2_OCTVU|nr:Hypothetical predicted protein [Octopus vulgaris]
MGGIFARLFSFYKNQRSTDDFCLSAKLPPKQKEVTTLTYTKSKPINIPYKIPRAPRLKRRRKVNFRLSSSDSEENSSPSSLCSAECKKRVLYSRFRRFRVEARREENHGKYKRLTSGLERSSEKYSNEATTHEIPVNRISRKYKTFCKKTGKDCDSIECKPRKS